MSIFIISAAVALIILIIQFIRQVHRTKKGNNELSKGVIFFNWLVLLVFLVGVGGAVYTGINSHRAAAKPTQPVKAASSSTPVRSADQAIQLDFTPDVTMDGNGQVNLKITVSRGSTVTIKGRNTGHAYDSFTVAKGHGTTTKVITLDAAGPYQVVARRNGKETVKDLIVRQAKTATVTSTPAPASQSSTRQATVNSNATTETSGIRRGSTNPAAAASTPGTANTSSQTNNQ